MEMMQCYDEMSYWDSIGSLQLEDELFLSESVSNNWEPGHELGTKFTNEPPCGGSKPVLPFLDKSDETDLLSGLDELGDVPDAEFHDWMEMKFNLSDFDVLETLNSLTTDKPSEVVESDKKESENYLPLVLTAEDEPMLQSTSPVVVVTPPDSPQDTSSQVPSTQNSNSSLPSSASEFLVSLTPPDTPPSAAETATLTEVAVYPEIFITVNVEDIVEVASKPEVVEVISQPITAAEPAARISSRRKPYSRRTSTTKVKETVPAVKKERKRDQNRDAATRYRLKKRAETDAILQDEKALQTKNKELQDQVENISNEIKYLKNLLKDVFLARAQAKK